MSVWMIEDGPRDGETASDEMRDGRGREGVRGKQHGDN